VDFSVGELVAAGTALAGVGAAWGALSHRLRDQGRRIGKVEGELRELKGFVTGTRYRKRTKPEGEPIAEG
jgi:hypothetical protein